MFQKVVGMGKAFGIKDGPNQAFIGCLKDCHRQTHNDYQAPRQLAEKWDQTYGDKLFTLFLRLRGLSMPLSLLFWKSVTCLAEVSSQKDQALMAIKTHPLKHYMLFFWGLPSIFIVIVFLRFQTSKKQKVNPDGHTLILLDGNTITIKILGGP